MTDNQPQERELHLISTIRSLQAGAEIPKKQLEPEWQRYEEFFDGVQWKNQGFDDKDSWKSRIVINHIYSVIDQIFSIGTDEPIQAIIAPVEGGDKATALALQLLHNYTWEKNNCSEVVEELFHDALLYGTGILGVDWNPDCGSEGDVEIRAIDPRHFFPDPHAKDLPSCRYVFEQFQSTVSELIELYPDKEEAIKQYHEGGGTFDSGQESQSGVAYKNPGRDRGIRDMTAASSDIPDGLKRTTVTKCWIKDDAVSEEIEMDADGKAITDDDDNPIYKKSYPGGRLIIFTGSVILEDEANPYDHGQFPYIVLKMGRRRGFWGQSVAKTLIDPQKEINKRRSQLIDNATALGNAIWLVPTESGVKASMLGSRPNMMIPHAAGYPPLRVSPPALPDYMPLMVEMAQGDIENLSGIHDVTKGQTPQGVTAASAIIALQEKGQTKVRPKIRWLWNSVGRATRLMVANYMQFYSEGRIRRILDQKTVDDVIVARLTSEIQKTDKLKFSKSEIFEMYDIQVSVESLTKQTKASRQRDAIELYNMRDEYGRPLIDRTALLKALDWPDAEDIVKRLDPPPAPSPMPEQTALPPAEEGGGVMPGRQNMTPLPENIPPEVLQMIGAAEGGNPVAF